MLLSELELPGEKVKIVRDKEFSDLGLIEGTGNLFLSFFYDERYSKHLGTNSNLACVVTTPELADRVPEQLGLICCEDPSAVFYNIHRHLGETTSFYSPGKPTRVDSGAEIHPSAHIGSEDVILEEGVVVEPLAVILPGTHLKKNVVVRAQVVVGGCGFEPKDVRGEHVIIPHYGGVVIGEGCEIQSGSHIARSIFREPTRLGPGTKVDALVHVAHNVVAGADCEFAAGAVIAGSVTLGDRVWVGPGAVVSSMLNVGDGAYISLGAVVVKDVEAAQRVSGNFAIPHKLHIRNMIRQTRKS